MSSRSGLTDSAAAPVSSLAVLAIEGQSYSLPDVTTLTMDEAMVMYSYGELTLDQIADGRADPRLIASLIHIALKRAMPDRAEAEVRALVGGLKLADVAKSIAAAETAEEEDARPPASPPASGPLSGAAASAAPNGDEASSGETSSESGADFPALDRADSSGLPASAIGLASGRAISGS